MSPTEFRVVALISCYNEGDIISRVIEHLSSEGIETYLIDDHSTDDTVEQASRWLGRGLIGVEKFPVGGARSHYAWGDILRRKEELAATLEADWFIHQDADEFRESPFPLGRLREAIQWVDRLGYNCVDFRTIDFCPIDDGFRQGDDPRTYFGWAEEARGFNRLQRKAWKASRSPVNLRASGGHDVAFPERRVFPIRFLLRHYPIRGQAHGLRKVLAERKARFLESERSQGWHVQYDEVQGESHRFVRDPGSLTHFDSDRVRFELLLPSENARAALAARDEVDEKVRAQSRALAEAQERAARSAQRVEALEGALRNWERRAELSESRESGLKRAFDLAVEQIARAGAERERLIGENSRLAQLAGREQARREALQSRLRDAEDRAASRPWARIWAPLRRWRQLRRDLRVIRVSPCFDPAWYLLRNADVAQAGWDPAEHYLRFGAGEDRDPGPRFSSREYLKANPDVAALGYNPLVHFERFGRTERRLPALRETPDGGGPDGPAPRP